MMELSIHARYTCVISAHRNKHALFTLVMMNEEYTVSCHKSAELKRSLHKMMHMAASKTVYLKLQHMLGSEKPKIYIIYIYKVLQILRIAVTRLQLVFNRTITAWTRVLTWLNTAAL